MKAYSVAAFMADARAAIREEGLGPRGRDRIADLLRALADSPDVRERTEMQSIHGSGSVATMIGSDPETGATLMLARFSAATPVHDHRSWGVACVVQGRDRYVAWDRLDDGSDRDRARLRVRFERELGPKDVVSWDSPPDDIHSQQGIDGAALELVYFGSDPNVVERAYFDPESGGVTHGRPQ